MNARFRKKLLVLAAAGSLAVAAVPPANAIFGVGDIVLDPSNLAQNILTAERTLAMINNQVVQLTNEAQMLINQARNLQNLDFNTLNRLRSTLATVDRLFAEARGLAYNLSRVESEFARLYPQEYAATVTRERLNADRREQWVNSHEALSTTLRVQAQAAANFADDEAVLADLIDRSQSAVGALQAAQATNQLLALQARQLMQAQQLHIAQERAVALEHARTVAAEERARELRRQFMKEATHYTPEGVALFSR